MSNKSAAAATVVPTVVSFAEESCFDRNEAFRTLRTPVVFRLFSVGKRLGRKLDLEMVSDYGVYYDGDNSYLIAALRLAAPGIDWDRLVFWCDPNYSRITIIDPTDDRTVALLETRKYHGKRVSAEKVDAGEYGPNVMSFDEVVRRQRERLEKEQAE